MYKRRVAVHGQRMSFGGRIIKLGADFCEVRGIHLTFLLSSANYNIQFHRFFIFFFFFRYPLYCTKQRLSFCCSVMALPVVDTEYLKEIDKARRHLRSLIANRNCAPIMLRLAYALSTFTLIVFFQVLE